MTPSAKEGCLKYSCIDSLFGRRFKYQISVSDDQAQLQHYIGTLMLDSSNQGLLTTGGGTYGEEPSQYLDHCDSE